VIAPLFGADAAAAKKCKKGQKPCGKRCCPRGQRCENDICVRTCAQPGTCDSGSKPPPAAATCPTPAAAGRRRPTDRRASRRPASCFNAPPPILCPAMSRSLVPPARFASRPVATRPNHSAASIPAPVHSFRPGARPPCALCAIAIHDTKPPTMPGACP
jgi:hypothetical protein